MPHEGQMGVHFMSEGHRLLGTLFLAQDDMLKPTAILLHGVPGIEKNYDIALMLRERGWNSLLIHYRGCWGSKGLYEFKKLPTDVRAVLDYLTQGRHPQIDLEHLVLIGHSMGGWTALLTAPDEPRVKAVAVYGAVCNSQTIGWDVPVIEQDFTPWLTGLSAQAFHQQWAALDDEVTPTQQVARIRQPLLIIHGNQDEVVSVQQAHDLHQNAGQNAQLHVHPEANHSFTWHRSWLKETLWTWLESLT